MLMKKVMKSSRWISLLTLLAAWPSLSQEWAKARLEQSPRHLEWVKVKHGDREVQCFIAFPEVKEKATAVVVIHEIFGLTDWVRGVADQLAEGGYIAIAPDLLSGAGPGGGGTSELMKKAGQIYEPVTYEGAGHGFMRAGEAPDANDANKKARLEGWRRWKELLKRI